MRFFRPALFAAAALAAAGVAGLAAAEVRATHVLTIRLPGGQIEQIRYAGDVAPQVRISRSAEPMDLFAPAADRFGPSWAFAQMQAISTAMNHQAAMMLQQAATAQANVTAGPGDLTLARVNSLPPGAHGVYMVWTSNGNGGCARTVEYASSGAGRTPAIVSRTSGDCGPTSAPTGASPTHDRAPAPVPGLAQPVAFHN